MAGVDLQGKTIRNTYQSLVTVDDNGRLGDGRGNSLAVDSLNSTDAERVLSARMGSVLNQAITANSNSISSIQNNTYTKAETDDLLDGKADQTALDATNQAVDDLDDRVDTGEDAIAGLESSKANLEGGNDFSGDQAVIRTRTKHQISKFIGTAPGNNECIILFGPSSETIHIAGTILAINDIENTQRDQMRINLTASTESKRYNVSLQKNTGWHPDMRIVTCEYNGEAHSGLLIGGSSGTTYPNRHYFAGVVVGNETYPLALPATSVTNIESEMALNESQNIFLSDTTIYTGTVTADDFITQSRVESDNANALRALDNIAEWKKKDGSIDYKKHYAYTPRIIRDEKGKVIEEVPGLSMEKRVAMLEKMVAELSGQIQNSKTQRK